MCHIFDEWFFCNSGGHLFGAYCGPKIELSMRHFYEQPNIEKLRWLHVESGGMSPSPSLITQSSRYPRLPPPASAPPRCFLQQNAQIPLNLTGPITAQCAPSRAQPTNQRRLSVSPVSGSRDSVCVKSIDSAAVRWFRAENLETFHFPR